MRRFNIQREFYRPPHRPPAHRTPHDSAGPGESPDWFCSPLPITTSAARPAWRALWVLQCSGPVSARGRIAQEAMVLTP